MVDPARVEPADGVRGRQDRAAGSDGVDDGLRVGEWRAGAIEVVDDARRLRLAVHPVDAIDDEPVATGVLLLGGARCRTKIVEVADHRDLDGLRSW